MEAFLNNTLLKDNQFEIPTRDGIHLQKGVVLNQDYLFKHFHEIENLFDFFMMYPDIFLDIIKPQESNFTLFFYQRMVLRALMRYKEVYITAPRAFSKSFITILAMFLQCTFIPGTRRFICAPNKNQGAQIAKEKIMEIYDKFPLLRKEILGHELTDTPGNFGKDYVEIKWRNGSTLQVVGALDSTRGQRKHGGLIDELRDHEEGLISDVVLPLLNVSRRLPDNTVNIKEINQQTAFMTSAGTKTSFAYNKLLDVFENSIIDPYNSFCFGCDYRVPMMHGLVDKTFINKLKMSPSYNEHTFAREYLSIWTGAADDAWFNFDKMEKHRKLKNPEYKARKEQSNQFYLISVDVGRIHDSTVVSIFRVNILNGIYYATLVNLKVLGTTDQSKAFSQQALDLKKIIRAFNPKEVCIDTNGLTY